MPAGLYVHSVQEGILVEDIHRVCLRSGSSSFPGQRRHSSINDATSAVHPVWCDAPMPAPLSP